MTGAGTGLRRWITSSGMFGASASYLLSAGVPLILGLALIPSTLDSLGAASFGLLTLYWTVLTFLGNFDFGVSQTLTKLLATKGEGPLDAEENRLTAATLLIQTGIGLALAALTIVAIALIGPLKSNAIWSDHTGTFVLVLLTFPVMSVSAGIRAALEARRDFHFVSTISLLTGVTQFAIPWFLSLRGIGIDTVILALALARIVISAAMFQRLYQRLRFRPDSSTRRAEAIRKVWRTGSWIAVSSFVNPVLLYVDRMILPFFFSLQTLVGYLLPLDFLLRLMIAPVAVNRISYSYLHQSGPDGAELRMRTYSKVAIAMSVWGAGLLVGAILAPTVLTIWLGADFAETSAPLAQITMVALSFSGLSYLATNMLIAVHRSSFEPKIQICIFPVFLVALLLAMKEHSLEWVAFALLARVVIHCVMLLLAIRNWIPETRRTVEMQLAAHLVGATLVLIFRT